MKEKSKQVQEVPEWRITVSVPGQWKPKLKSDLAQAGMTISQLVIRAIHDFSDVPKVETK